MAIANLNKRMIQFSFGAAGLVAFEADTVLAAAAAEAGIPMMLSAASLAPLEKVRQAGGASVWYQGYFHGHDRPGIARLLDRVSAAGRIREAVLVFPASRRAPGRRGASRPHR